MSPTLSIFNKRNTPPMSSKSLESFQSSASCCPREYSTLQMYKKPSRLLGQAPLHKTVSEVRQRVTSARLNRLRTVQNQLSDAHGHIGELLNENRVLRTIHKRQDNALQRYEGTNADLPQLLNSHAEEVRVWQVRCRNLQSQNRELGNKLKQKDAQLLSLTDHNRHLSQLNADKNLEERDKLSDRVRSMETIIAEKDDELKVLHRRLQLDAKDFKKQINSGMNKQKELMLKLDKANAEILRIGEIIRTESLISPSKMSLGTYLRSNKQSSTIPTKINFKPKNSEVKDRSDVGDSTKKDTCANRLKTVKSPTASPNSSKPVARNYSQQSSDAFPLMKSYMADKSNRTRPLGLSSKIRNSMMDFTDIKYPSGGNATKPLLKNSSSMDSSDTAHSTIQYDEDEFDSSSTTQGTNDPIDTVESLDDMTIIGDYNYEKYRSYSDQRTVEKQSDDAVGDIEQLRKNVREELIENESFLDQFCESLTKDVNIVSNDAKKNVKNNVEKARLPVRSGMKGKECVPKKGRASSGTTKKKSLDPSKKTELLAQLKAIDGAH